MSIYEEDPLKKQFETLQEDWNSYKRSIPRHRRAHSTALTTTTTTTTKSCNNGNDIFSLIFLDNSPKKLLSTLQDNKTNLRSWPLARKVEGRRSLLDAFDSVKDSSTSHCSSVLIDQELVSDSSSSSSSSDSNSDSSSGEVKERRSGEERWIMRMIRVFVAVWMIMVGVSLAMPGLRGEGKCGEYVTPT